MAGSMQQYFTDRAEPSLAQVARGIGSEHEEFATDFLCDPTQDESDRIRVRLVAWYQHGAGAWQAAQVAPLGGRREGIRDRSSLHRFRLAFR